MRKNILTIAALACMIYVGFTTKGLLAKQNPQIAAINGVAGQAVDGFMPNYDMSGNILKGYSCVVVKGNSTTSGTFSLTYTASPLWSGSPTLWIEGFTIKSPGTALTQSYVPFYTTLTSTSLAGDIYTPVTLVVLGNTVAASTTAQAVTGKVCGY